MCYLGFITHFTLHSHTMSNLLCSPHSEIQGCGGFSSEDSGVIKSDNWPMNYAPNRECMWRVQVPEGKTITLTFTHFDLEAASILFSSCLDNVVIYDGAHGTAKKYGKH